jgi:hypothetical protein
MAGGILFKLELFVVFGKEKLPAPFISRLEKFLHVVSRNKWENLAKLRNKNFTKFRYVKFS